MKNIRMLINRFKKWKKNKKVRHCITAAAVILSALLQAYVIQVFIRPVGIISGGFSGIAMLIEKAGEAKGFQIPMQVTMLILNIPVALLCCKGISVRFTVFSLAQVALNSLFLQICWFRPLLTDEVLNVIFGGVLFGLSIVIVLRGNASSGGTDFIALFVSNRTGRSIWSQVFVGNALMYCVFGLLFDWKYAGYSIIFQFISTRMISAFHHRYERVTLQITTMKGSQLAQAYIKNFKHGISVAEAVGGYSKKKMYLLHTVVSSYEVNDIVHLLQEVDEHVIINMMKTEAFYGTFYQAPME